MWTNGIDDRWYNDAEFKDLMFGELQTNARAADAFGAWVSEEFTGWDAFEWAVLAHERGEDPLRSMYDLWMDAMMQTDRSVLERLFGYEWWPKEVQA